ncbi:hypothetical protein V6N11_070829 [Hibiscus sabdariffa]|uniref:Uncharacterized protein n=2 Tax=Hibiscus sabdariffa TaxID=183260 RepID=A0ABR1ZB56_9ROSI
MVQDDVGLQPRLSESQCPMSTSSTPEVAFNSRSGSSDPLSCHSRSLGQSLHSNAEFCLDATSQDVHGESDSSERQVYDVPVQSALGQSDVGGAT